MYFVNLVHIHVLSYGLLHFAVSHLEAAWLNTLHSQDNILPGVDFFIEC